MFKFIKKYFPGLYIFITILCITIIIIMPEININSSKNAYAQRKSKNISSTTVLLRDNIISNDVWINSLTAMGTAFDSTDYREVRVYADVGGTNNASWTVRCLIWNATLGKWAEDSDETELEVSGTQSWLVRTNHASSVFFMVDTKTGTSPSISLYVQGSNE
ncbi:MAG: hypothetical protein ACFFG0_09480 [Candidatus Thorarchaeota archaeon]